eukprot:TRINITY_DN8338_c0_g1_i1.p1 TRINITY_DN8338_c0_g1~~TRINITY_DN8338_c0_g1_i1.p1  ORF type:complete len:197 (+),score=45.78 TRINITY_DN8338_c0_g1_i1:33-623(+)
METIEEIGGESIDRRKERKKLKRKLKRQKEYMGRESQSCGEDDANSENEEQKQDQSGNIDPFEQEKKIYGVQLPPNGKLPRICVKQYREGDELDEAGKVVHLAPRHHHGLRCLKCFSFLARDEDFDYTNGQLWVHPPTRHDRPNPQRFLVRQGGRVYCENMHAVGNVQETTWANQTRFVFVIKVEKTTFMENYVNK